MLVIYKYKHCQFNVQVKWVSDHLSVWVVIHERGRQGGMGTSPIVTSPDSSWGTGIPTSWINIQVWRGNGVLDSLSHSPIFEHKHCQGLLRQYLTLQLHHSQETDLLQLEDLYVTKVLCFRGQCIPLCDNSRSTGGLSVAAAAQKLCLS